jgi:hypothetical protein
MCNKTNSINKTYKLTRVKTNRTSFLCGNRRHFNITWSDERLNIGNVDKM